MKKKLTKKDYLKIVLIIITFIVASTIFSDWEHFKAGLFGLELNQYKNTTMKKLKVKYNSLSQNDKIAFILIASIIILGLAYIGGEFIGKEYYKISH